jgi:lipoprotein-anchoring transpeptidase ErfK/SrfK
VRKAIWIPLLVVVVLAGAGTAAAAVYDHGRRDRIAEGIAIAGVPVGGLDAAAARAKVDAALRRSLGRDIAVHAGGKSFHLTAERLDARANPGPLIEQAVRRSRQGGLFTRTLHGLRGHQVDLDLSVPVSYSHAAVHRITRRVASTLDRSAKDASVAPSAAGLVSSESRTGIEVDTASLRKDVAATAVRLAGTRIVRAHLKTIQPHVTTSELAGKYPAYIIVDRESFKLRFFQHLKLTRTYDVAIGQSGLETPQGLYDIQWKQVNPSWYVPNSAWAGDLAGKVIPPGPDDPIKARWMAFDGAAGIHGVDPSEYPSIGHQASHGCVRMRIPDVIDLYAMTPVGTPVYIA